MTDKQIIIDGCDVSKCIYFQQEDDEYTCGAEECNGAIVACRACDNCYYKQLKRAEQRIVEVNKTIQAKEQECEELRGVIRKDICSHYVLGECSQKHHNNCVGRNQCIQDLEQKLEKIKQYLCENVCLEGENCKFCDNHDCINIEVLKIIEE